VDIEWEPTKAAANLAKHRVDFSDAVGAFLDELALTVADDRSPEDRFVTLGADFGGRLLVVVYTCRGDTVRLISAREATRHERKQYEETP
jgi:hypothetical protein